MNKRGMGLPLLIILILGIIVLMFSIFVLYNNYLSLNGKNNLQDNIPSLKEINQTNPVNIYPAPEGYSLLSDFFKNDATAISIINGGSYNLSDDDLYMTSGNENFLSFEFKLINAFKQIGYTGLTNYNAPEDSASTSSLHRFEKTNNLPISSNILDGRTLALIDTKLFDIETKDKTDSAKYSPLIKFIESPLNGPPKEHLAALYYRFYQALPQDIPDINHGMARTIDEFRIALQGMGGNLGTMLDVSGTRILSFLEMLDIINNKDDFKFCASSYYLAFNSGIGGNCVNPPTNLNIFGTPDDYSYFYTFVHEFSHGVGTNDITIGGVTDTINNQFGKISFGGDFSCVFENCPSDSLYWIRQDNNYDEFITEYSRNGYTILEGFAQGTLSPYEDFAESFAFYMLQGNIFRKRAKDNIYLQQKYDFLKSYVFKGIEYNTGNPSLYESWLSENPNATSEQLYEFMNRFRGGSDIGIWNGNYPTL